MQRGTALTATARGALALAVALLAIVVALLVSGGEQPDAGPADSASEVQDRDGATPPASGAVQGDGTPSLSGPPDEAEGSSEGSQASDRDGDTATASRLDPSLTSLIGRDVPDSLSPLLPEPRDLPKVELNTD